MKLFTVLRASVAALFFLSTSSAYAVFASASWSPSSAQTGQTQTFSWSSSGANSGCVLNSSGAGVSASGSYSVTAGSPGSYSETVTCFNFGPFGPESNSATATRTVTAATPAPTVSASWSPASREQNSGNQTFSWSSTNATSCNVGNGAASGSFSVSASSVGSFTQSVTCTGAGGSATTSATRTVTAPTPTPTVSASWSPSSRQVNTGNQTFSWSSSNATSCNVGNGAASGSFSVSASSVGSFSQSVTCTGAGGSATASATRTVTAAPPPPAPTVSASWSPSSRQVNTGNQTFSWSSSNATSCNVGNGAASGSFSVSASSVGSFSQSVTCTGAGGSATTSATRTVIPPLPDQPVVTVPATDVDGNYTVTWTSETGATSYDLRIDLPGGATSWQQIYSGSATSKAESGRGEGVHQYIARACNSSGCSGWSGAKSITVDATPAIPFFNPITNNSNGEAVVSWLDVGASSYELEYYLDVPDLPDFSGWQPFYQGSATSQTSAVLVGLAVRVRACNGSDCSSWTSSTAPPPAPTVTLTYTPSTVYSGQPTTYAWSSTYATTCVNQANVTRATSGSFSYTPTATHTETLTCTGAGGSTSVTKTITVEQPNLTASWSAATPGQTQTLSWNWTNAPTSDVTCSLSETPAGESASLTGSSGTHTITAGSVGTYTTNIACLAFGSQGPEGGAGVNVTRTVGVPSTPNTPTGLNLSSPVNGAFNVSWNTVSDAQATYNLDVNGSVVSNPANPYPQNRPAGTYTYRVQACNNAATTPCSGWSGPQSVTVEQGPVMTASWSTNPVNRGSQSTLSWSATHASSCTIPSISGNQNTTGSQTYPITTSSDWNPSISCTGEGGTTSINVLLEVDPEPAKPTLHPVTINGNGEVVVSCGGHHL